jgi:hypothetical protein
MTMLQNGLLFPSRLVGLDRVEGLDHVCTEGDGYRLGILRTFKRLAALQKLPPALAATLSLAAIGVSSTANHRVRHATVNGALSTCAARRHAGREPA